MSESPICTVCQYSLCDNYPLVITRCRHIFHKVCILNWLSNASSCPYCRTAVTKTSLLDYTLPIDTPSSLNINPNSGTVPKNTERIILSKNARKKRNDANRNLSFPPTFDSNLINLLNMQPDLSNNTSNTILPNMTENTNNPSNLYPQLNNNPENSVNEELPSTSQAALEKRIADGLQNKFNSEFTKINEMISRMSEQLSRINVQTPPFSNFTNPPINSILNYPQNNSNVRSVNFDIPSTTIVSTSTYTTNVSSNVSSIPSTSTSVSSRLPQNFLSTPISSTFSHNSQNPITFSNNINNLRPDFSNITQNPNRSVRSNYSNLSSDLTQRSKIAHLVSSWNLTFAGSNSGIPVEKFIFMVNSLVQDTLGGDFSVLSEHCHILFTGKAKQWFWDYRLRNPERIEWQSLSYALEAHYNDHLSDIDIRKLIDSRKQNNSESFDDYYHDILRINDRLRRKLTEHELVDTLKRNVKPYLRKELFYLQIHSVSELRNLVLRREALTLELDGYPAQRVVRRQINELDEPSEESNPNISEVRERKPKVCFNCKIEGHHFRQCPNKLTLFCFNCGKHGFYNFNCDNCSENRQTSIDTDTHLCS